MAPKSPPNPKSELFEENKHTNQSSRLTQLSNVSYAEKSQAVHTISNVIMIDSMVKRFSDAMSVHVHSRWNSHWIFINDLTLVPSHSNVIFACGIFPADQIFGVTTNLVQLGCHAIFAGRFNSQRNRNWHNIC